MAERCFLSEAEEPDGRLQYHKRKVLKAIGASKLAVQFTGYNLLTFDKLKIFDPEGELTRDDNTYPVMKIFSLGVNVTFNH